MSLQLGCQYCAVLSQKWDIHIILLHLHFSSFSLAQSIHISFQSDMVTSSLSCVYLMCVCACVSVLVRVFVFVPSFYLVSHHVLPYWSLQLDRLVWSNRKTYFSFLIHIFIKKQISLSFNLPFLNSIVSLLKYFKSFFPHLSTKLYAAVSLFFMSDQ